MPNAESPRDPAKLERSVWVLPALLTLALSFPVLGFPYLWDDFMFLNEARSFGLRSLLHHKPLDPFYRPLSRELYFAVLQSLGPSAQAIAHILNYLFLVGSVFLLVRFLSRILGSRAGVIAGLVFASVGVAPFLVGWVSGIQDLLAIFMILLAFVLQSEGKTLGALVASACALLSKETAAMFLPVIALVPWLQGMHRKPPIKSLAAYAGLGIGWALMHPGIMSLFRRHFGARETDYIGGVHALPALEHLGRYLLTLLNLPQPDWPAPWPLNRTLPALLGLVVMAVSLRFASYLPATTTEKRSQWSRVLLAGVYLSLAPLLLTAATVQGWAPYYAGIGGLGISFIAASLSTRRVYRAVAAVLVLFLVLGVWQRGQGMEEGKTTEWNFWPTAKAIYTVESGFKSIRPRFPPDSRIVVSVQARGVPGIYVHMYLMQAIREWYNDPTLTTVRPEFRRTRLRPEFFFVITPELRVGQIDPDRYAVYPQNLSLEYSSGERAVRAYALGCFASGEVERAALLLLRMPEVNEPMRNSHRRLAAALLLASGRRADAESILVHLTPLPQWYSLQNIAVFLAQPLPTKPIEAYVFQAFDISWEDRNALLYLARWCEDRKYAGAGLRFVRRLLQVYPNDPKGKELLQQLENSWRASRMFRLPQEDGPPPPSEPTPLFR